MLEEEFIEEFNQAYNGRWNEVYDKILQSFKGIFTSY